jgi:CheY-like chemotaxis protein
LHLRYPATDNVHTQQALRAIATQAKAAMQNQLPAASVSAAATKNPSENAIDFSAPAIPFDRAFENFSVVLIDDEPLVSDALATLLNSWGMTAYCATNGHEAKKLVQEHKPQLVISDYHLGKDEFGTDVIAMLRQLQPELPALIVTGGGDVPTLQSIRRSGLDVLAKPVRPARLRALLQHLLSVKN